VSDFGVYVHVPFCAERCGYCAFVTYVGADELHETYVQAVIAELERARELGRLSPASSVFFGGGTPSRLEPDLLASILQAIPRREAAEVTVEVNPEDASAERLGALVDAGVTRFSVGIQSTAPRVLAALGRRHRGGPPDEIAAAISASGAATWSADIIIGASSEHDEDLLATLDDLLGLNSPPPHLSCYLLSVERGTALSRDPARHPDDDVQARRYELLDEQLEARGYRWYELSNWARPGQECRHNQLYWSQGDYLGLGPAAHSHASGRRSWNVASLTTYLERIAQGEDPTQGVEILSEAERALEALSLSLRCSSGVPAESLDADELAGFVECVGDRLVLTRRGRLMANAVATGLRIGQG